MLNMIVGVVVENFQRCRERLEDEEKQRRRRKMLDKARSKNQQGGYYVPSFCACSAAPTISTFRNNFIIMLFGLSVSQIYFVCQKASLQKLSMYARCTISQDKT